jgi:hypothetical protein
MLQAKNGGTTSLILVPRLNKWNEKLQALPLGVPVSVKK